MSIEREYVRGNMKLPSGMHNWPSAAFLAGGVVTDRAVCSSLDPCFCRDDRLGIGMT